MRAAPYGPYPKYLDPAVCVGAAEACGTCRNCQLAPRWERGRYDADAVQAEWGRLQGLRKAPMSALETLAALDEQSSYYDAWDHVPCEPPRCPHGQDLSWYQTVHCEDCRDPWPCDTALRVCARIWLQEAHTTHVVPEFPIYFEGERVGTGWVTQDSQVDSSSASPTPKDTPA